MNQGDTTKLHEFFLKNNVPKHPLSNILYFYIRKLLILFKSTIYCFEKVDIEY